VRRSRSLADRSRHDARLGPACILSKKSRPPGSAGGRATAANRPQHGEAGLQRGTLLAAQNFHHSYPYCWRSKTPIIFRNVEQFFIRIDQIRGKALQAIHRQVKWIPAWGENRIAGTVESSPDWVISRKRSSGVTLPVLYAATGEYILGSNIIRKLADLVAEHGQISGSSSAMPSSQPNLIGRDDQMQ
jgi:valyl-tRNA synthetase